MNPARWVTEDGGWRVDVIHLSGVGARTGDRGEPNRTPHYGDGEWLRVHHCNLFVACVRTPAELEQFFPLTALRPWSWYRAWRCANLPGQSARLEAS
jgi:hypothetical protein